MGEERTRTIDRDRAIGESLRRLELAVRTWRMYPPSSPVVDQSVFRLHEALRDALRGRDLTVDVRPTELGWRGAGDERRRAELTELATRLHRHRIGRLRLAADLPKSSIEAVVAAIARDESPGVPSSLCQGKVSGVDAEVLDLGGLLTGGGAEIESVWDHVLNSFGDASGNAVDWSQMADHADRAREFLKWALDPGTQPNEMAAHSQTDGFALLCEQIAGHVSQIDDTVQTLVDASVGLFDDLDPEAWMDLLTDPIHLGGRDETESIDLTPQIAQALSTNQILKLVRYAIRSRTRESPRLFKFLSRVLGDREDADLVAAQVRSEVGSDPDFARSWPQLLELLDSESPEKWAGLDYRATVNREELATPASPWNVARFRPRFKELDAGFLRVRKARLAHSMLRRERDEQDYGVLAEAIADGIPDIVAAEDFSFLEEIVATLSRHVDETHRSEGQRAAAQRTLQCLQHPQLSVTIARGLARCNDDTFHALWRVIEHLGAHILPELLEVMAETRSPSYRHHLARILAEMADVPMDHLRNRIEDRRTNLARDLTSVLVTLDQPRFAPLIQLAAKHPDASVRREAMSGLAATPDDEAELRLVEALSDSALEVRVAALRAFRTRFFADSTERLTRYLRLPNRNGSHTTLIVAAARALGRIGSEDALPELARLDRWVLLYRRRRLPVRHAVQQAMEEIRARSAESREADHELEGDLTSAPESTGTDEGSVRRAA